MQLDELYPILIKKRIRNFAEASTCELLTYTVNTVKLEYLPLDKARGANILTLLVWRLVLSFDINMSYFREGQYKHLHCQIRLLLQYRQLDQHRQWIQTNWLVMNDVGAR